MTSRRIKDTLAYLRGRLHAGGREDFRNYYHGTEFAEAYEAGYRDYKAEIMEETVYHEHPLRLINNRTEVLLTRESTDGGTITEIAILIRDLTEYLLEKESN